VAKYILSSLSSFRLTFLLYGANFQRYWNPNSHIAIDEMIHLFKGKSKNKVYNKSKPTKWGLKYYLAAGDFKYCLDKTILLYKG
jgi:hypothetical protein